MPVRKGYLFSPLERTVERTFGNAEARGRSDVETAGPRAFHKRIAIRRHPVVHVEDHQQVLAPVEGVPGPHLDEIELVSELAEDALESAEEVEETGWAVDGEGQLPTSQREGLQHARKAQIVVRVVVGQKDFRELHEPDPRAQKLSLRPFAAIDQNAFPGASDQRCRGRAACRRHRAGRPEEDEVEIHVGQCTAVHLLRRLKAWCFGTDTGTVAVPRNTPIQRVSRSVTLLRAFLIVSALLLAAGGFVLGTVLTHALRAQALDDAKRSLAQYTSGVLGSSLVYGSQLKVGPTATTVVRRDLAERPDILSVKVWRSDGVLAWTTLAPERIGRRFPVSGDLREVIEHGTPAASFEDTHGAEDASEANLGVESVIEVYAPVIAAGEVVGAYEIYADATPLEASIAGRKQVIWFTTAGVFFALWGLLVLLVRRASDTLRRQTTTLRERSVALSNAYEALERNALEAVESLNATVEAKDPYTAGHSLRVQRIALAMGDELGFTPIEMDALRFGALFHDIGKIAVPDGILTKPGRLTSEEYEEIKRHSAEGARIIEKFSRLREAVPIVRHHHERWDGKGYPDGLSTDAIPVAAAIAGLADAWDAMTTDRPYQEALTLDAAMNEVRNGRGTQFIPVVVDAFFAVANRRPEELWIDEAEPLAAS